MNSRSFGCFGIVICGFGMILILLLIWYFANFSGAGVTAGRPVLNVSPEVTVFTEPLDANGDVDYLEAMNQMLSNGISPENNAVVLLVQATGPILSHGLNDEFCDRLGIDRLPEDGEYFRKIADWKTGKNKKRGHERGARSSELEKLRDPTQLLMTQYDFALENPWSADELPELNQWLTANQKSLKLVEEATRRTGYYHPMVSARMHNRVMSCDLALCQIQRDFARALTVRANRHLESGEFEPWFEDAMTIYRLSSLSGKGNTFIELLIAIAISGIADANVVTAIESGKFNKDQLLEVKKVLNEFPRIDDFSRFVRHGEKLSGLDAICSFARYGNTAFDPDAGTSFILAFGRRAVDWNEVAMNLATMYDQLAEKAAVKDHKKRSADLEANDSEKWQLIFASPDYVSVIVGGRKARGRMMGDFMAGMLLPAMIQVNTAYCRYLTNRDMVRLALAIEAFRLDKGSYPDSLDILVADYISEVPVDSFTGTAFSYSANEGDYLFYSFAQNGTDDGGDSQLFSPPLDLPLERKKPQTWEEFSKEELSE